MSSLPPQWVEAAEQADGLVTGLVLKAREDIKLIRDKLLQLEKAQSKWDSSAVLFFFIEPEATAPCLLR